MNGTINPAEPADVYFRRELDVATNSGLKIIGQRSAAHYYHYMTNPEADKDTPAKQFGHALHTGVLEPHTFESIYCVLPPDAPSRPTIRQINAKKPSDSTLFQIDWWRDWENRNAGRICLPDDTMTQLRAMTTSMRNHVVTIPVPDGKPVKIVVSELIDLCRKEVTLRWTDPRTGLKCKGRADLDCRELAFMGDLKSAVDASPDGFARAVHQYLYHQQHVHYTDGAQACGEPRENFLFFVCEKEPPYVPAVYFIPAMAEERGRVIRDKAMDRLKLALETGNWTGYTETITELNLPAYAYYDAND